MRLLKIKIAGFKSFVDPTTIPLPSNLIGVVGPNGCGKSNIIDAVRWVMGEISAKQLRGESMADVIFNGSSSRKPISQASIELIFDNSDHTITGEYASYTEIAIRRQVTRDGQSNYYLNGSKCRRKDITDIFLGTGLGPRSYSIIEQGMISRLIEAKPEEFRTFLEEAAGISKFRERRRETENRIKHTRENLERLTDLRDELEKQINHLQRQARSAERYKVLKEEERLCKAQLLALKWQSVQNDFEAVQAAISEQEIGVEQAAALLQHTDTEIEHERDSHVEANEKFNEVQSRYYQVGSEIARIEQSITHQEERRQQLQEDQQSANTAWQSAQETLSSDQQQVVELQTQVDALLPQVSDALSKAEEYSTELATAEERMHEWQGEWDAFNQEAAHVSETAQVEQTRMQHNENLINGNKHRLAKLKEEVLVLDCAPVEQALEELCQAIEILNDEKAGHEGQFENLTEQLSNTNQLIEEKQKIIDENKLSLQQSRGKLSSLEALQQAALGQDKDAMVEWLTGHALADAPRIAEELEVEAGWEKAVETVLGVALEGQSVTSLEQIRQLAADEPPVDLVLVEAASLREGQSSLALPMLQSKIRKPHSINGLVGMVYVVASIDEALSQRDRLQAHESIITQDGAWFGPNWLKVSAKNDLRRGVIERNQAIAELTQAIECLQEVVSSAEEDFSSLKEARQEVEAARDTLRQKANEFNKQFSDLNAKQKVKENQLINIRERRSRLDREQQNLAEEVELADAELTEAKLRWTEAMAQMESQSARREALESAREANREQLIVVRERARVERQRSHQLDVDLQSKRTRLDGLRQGLGRVEQQLVSERERCERLEAQIEELREPIAEQKESLESSLAQRLIVEADLTEARQILQAVDHKIRELEDARHKADEALQLVRSKLEQSRMNWQGSKVKRATYEEQLAETSFELKGLIDEMPEEATEVLWEEQVERFGSRIQRLGAINLAAIEEYDTQKERKVYLDEQNADLEKALETLENAIRKIDKETRHRFQETYDKVNATFQELFPRLFGGGKAYLELTDSDMLTTGVRVMARPPGKHNASIHLLSGGEKALTAVSLVFSIFQLNPAPFCLLDEVDAPLDDANVGRFCEMVREMSEKVQFLFITHNKVTMEMANQLLGVTMHEPGVSRLVSVDIAEAESLVEA